MKVIQHQPNVHEVKCEYSKRTTFDYLLLSDIHLDSKNCHRKLLKAHLDEIQKRNGLVFIFGDFFDVMGCYKDPRSKGHDILPQFVREDRSYLDLIIDDAYEFLKPYKDNLAVIGYGNHETSIQKYRDTDPIYRLTTALNQTGSIVTSGGYGGYVVFKYRRKTGGGFTAKLAYHHGHGGAKRSKGILNAQIDGFIYSDADIIASGHDHNKLLDPSNMRYYCTDSMKIVFKPQHWLKLGSYTQNDKTPLAGGWHTEKGFLPRRLGGWFMKQTVDGNWDRVKISFEEAQ
jgi:hypothetical protein